MARYNYYPRRQQEKKLINIISVPTSLDVLAVYEETNGTEVKTPVFLIGIYDNGDCHFLETDAHGSFDRPEQAQNFIRYEFQKR